MIASFEKKPAKPISVPGMPKPMRANVPISIMAQVNIIVRAHAAHEAHVLLVVHAVDD